MNEHDLHLIAQLAEGTLRASEEIEARALLDASDEARDEYAAQLKALAALQAARDAGPPLLEPAERSRLHRDLAEQLGFQPEPTALPAPRRRINWAWPGLATAAAVLIGVVVLAPFVGSLSTGGDGASDTTVSAAQSTLADTGEVLGLAEADDSGGAFDRAAEEAPTASPATPATETAPAATTTSAADMLAGETFFYLGIIGEDELQRLDRDAFRLSDSSRALLSAIADYPGATAPPPEVLELVEATAGCVDALPPTGSVLGPLLVAELGGTTIIAYQVGDAGTSPTLLVLDISSCAVVPSAGE